MITVLDYLCFSLFIVLFHASWAGLLVTHGGGVKSWIICQIIAKMIKNIWRDRARKEKYWRKTKGEKRTPGLQSILESWSPCYYTNLKFFAISYKNQKINNMSVRTGWVSQGLCKDYSTIVLSVKKGVSTSINVLKIRLITSQIKCKTTLKKIERINMKTISYFNTSSI